MNYCKYALTRTKLHCCIYRHYLCSKYATGYCPRLFIATPIAMAAGDVTSLA